MSRIRVEGSDPGGNRSALNQAKQEQGVQAELWLYSTSKTYSCLSGGTAYPPTYFRVYERGCFCFSRSNLNSLLVVLLYHCSSPWLALSGL